MRPGLRAMRGRTIPVAARLVALLLPIAGAAVAPAPTARYSGERSARAVARAACSPREPFAPPVVATLPSGVLALDARRGLAVVVSSSTTPRATNLSVSTYTATTGASVKSRHIATRPVARVAPNVVLNDDVSVVVDEATARIFVLHEPYAAGMYPQGRVDALDERSLTLLRSTPVGSIARPPALDARTSRVFVASQHDGAMSVFDARTGRLVRTVTIARGPLGPSDAPVVDEQTGKVFFAADTNRDNVVVLDARSGAILRRITAPAFPQTIAVDRRASRVVVASVGSASILDARTGTILRSTKLPGSPRELMVDETGHRAFVSYSDNVNISMLDVMTGSLLRTIPVRLDNIHSRRPLGTDQAENETYPLIDRVDERRRWVVVRVPAVMADDGPEQGPAQITVLDSRTGFRVHTVFSEPAWPDAVALDDRRGRAFSYVGGAIDLYDISCLTSYYIFGDMG